MPAAHLGLLDGQLHADAVAAAVAEGRPLRHLHRADAQEPAGVIYVISLTGNVGARMAGL